LAYFNALDTFINIRHLVTWFATESGWARSKRSTICSGKLCGGFIILGQWSGHAASSGSTELIVTFSETAAIDGLVSSRSENISLVCNCCVCVFFFSFFYLVYSVIVLSVAYSCTSVAWILMKYQYQYFRFVLSTGTRIRIDSMMKPRSSSRGRNTSTSVTVTVSLYV